jgi:molybdopterin synthase catalytic subunit
MSNQEYFILNEGPISPEIISELVSSVSTTDAGACSIFLGKIRADKLDDKIVKEIEYSAYAPMVILVVEDIVKEIRQKFDDLKSIKIIHSTGKVKVGEISLLVIVTCGHRSQSFKTLEETVEQIKAKLPVWKKEIFEDGSHLWPKNF